MVVENFRPGTMARLGLGPDELLAADPRLVYCSVTGFGTGEGAALPGYDLLVQAVGGLMSVTGDPDGEPTKTGVALVDVITGLHASLGILAALRHRERTGRGQLVEVSLLGSLLSALVNQASGYVAAGAVPGRLGNAHPSIAPYETFPTADRPIALAVGNDGQFAALAAALGRPGLATDPRFRTNPDRVAHRDELRAALRDGLSTHGADHWAEVLPAAGVPAGPVNTLDEAFAYAERLGLEAVVDAGGTPQVAHPIRFGATPATYRLGPPELGEHTDAVFQKGRAAPADRPRGVARGLSPSGVGTLRRMAVDRRTEQPGRAPARTRTNLTLGRALVRWTTTTDHKVIGNLYMTTSFCFFLFGGVLALLMRAELARPGCTWSPSTSTTSCSPCTARS